MEKRKNERVVLSAGLMKQLKVTKEDIFELERLEDNTVKLKYVGRKESTEEIMEVTDKGILRGDNKLESIVLPKDLMQKLELQPKDKVAVIKTDKSITLKKVTE